MSKYQKQCPIDGGTCGQGGTCPICETEALGSELTAAKARIAELEAQIKRESDARRKQKVTIDFARNQLDKAIAEHRQQQAKRIIELEKALERIKHRTEAYIEADTPMQPDSSVAMIDSICAAALLKESTND